MEDKPIEELLTKQVTFRVSDREFKALQQATEKAGLSRESEFIRRAIRLGIEETGIELEPDLFKERTKAGNWLPKPKGKESRPLSLTLGAV